MTSKHTAKSLGVYLGQEVYYPPQHKLYGICKLVAISTTSLQPAFISLATGEVACVQHKDVYPILKTVNDFLSDGPFNALEDEEIPYVEKEFNDFRNGDYYNHALTFEAFLFLSRRTYGAIPDDKSPSGYVDFFGYPCVTPKQVEEGVVL